MFQCKARYTKIAYDLCIKGPIILAGYTQRMLQSLFLNCTQCKVFLK